MDKTGEILWSESKDFIERALKKTGVPGCSVGVLHQGEIKTAGFGTSNLEKMSQVSGETLFQIGSISKTFTATLVLKLVEESKLDLHLPVRTYLPDFKVADETVSASVTPYHLLTHSAGWDGDLFLDTGAGEDAIHKYIQRMAVREQLYPLGEFYSYNNSGFVVLGGILEAVTQKPLEELYRSYIIQPLGLKHLFFTAADVITYDYSVGHQPTHDGNNVARPWAMPRCALSMGGIVTNVGDLLIYAQCYLAKGKTSNGKQLLSAELITEMFKPKQIINKEDRTSVGFSWMRRELENCTLISHGGGTNGQATQLTLLPEHDFALAIFTNSDRGGLVIEEVQKFLLKTYLNVTYQLPKVIQSSPEQLAACTGIGSRPGVNLYMDMMGKHLVGLLEDTVGFPSENDPPPPPLPPFRIGRCAEDRLIVLDGDMKDLVIDLFRDADGKINYLRASRMFRFSPKKI